MGSTRDVVVIGAGVIGCSVAYEFARAGRQVLVVDRARGAGMGSTSSSSAVVRFNYSTFTGVAAAWESRQAWDSWEEHLGGTDDGFLAAFHRTGGLFLDSPAVDSGPTLALFDQVGVPYERWTAAQIRDELPGIDPGRHYPPKPVTGEAFWSDPDGEIGGVWTPDAGFIDDPSFAAHNLMAAARRHGAEFAFGRSVVEIVTDDDRVVGVRTAEETIACDVVVNVAGPHSSVINDLAGVSGEFRITTRPLRQEVHELPGTGHTYPLVADLDLGTYLRSTPGGGVLVGGAEPECDPLEWLEDPDDFTATATRTGYEAQAYRAARRLPDLTVPAAVSGLAGVYDVSTDWIPIYDRTSLGGYYVAIGTSGNQFKNAPVVGSFLHAIVAATEAGTDHDVDPVEYKLPLTGTTVDLGHYSRLREPAATSGTVMG